MSGGLADVPWSPSAICPQLPSAYLAPLEAHLHALGLVDRSADHVVSRRPENEVQSEDCLNLNVITPCWSKVEAAKEEGGLPVVVGCEHAF